MAKKIEDFVVDLSYAELGVQVVVEIACPGEFVGVREYYTIEPLNKNYRRFKAMSDQIKRVLGFAGCLESIALSGYNIDFDTIQVQLSYKIGVKGDETRRVQTRPVSKYKTKQQRKKGKK